MNATRPHWWSVHIGSGTWANIDWALCQRMASLGHNELTHWSLGDLNEVLDKYIFKLVLVLGGWGMSCDIAWRWMTLDLNDDKSTLIQAMAWCHQATSHYLSQCWPSFMSPYGIARPQWANSRRAWHIPLPDDLGQIKLPVRQVDVSQVFFYILHKQIEKMKIFGSRASKNFGNVDIWALVSTLSIQAMEYLVEIL